jgi:DNA polymerase-3 subunit gamma/tau
MAKRKTTPEPTGEAAPAATEYTVLARRYRPQQFKDLVGQEAVAQALSNALTSSRVAHAYLFTGARGVGKTSTARILAKALNCEKGPTTQPCDHCDICQAITSGEDVDVLEIDGASNNGVDQVRELRANVHFRPSRARYKIYIIDEVHMLSTAAFNALLKTLEEPPPHVKFIFATTEIGKIPVTILSRCQRFDFGNITMPRILTRLREIVAGEGLQADEDALELIARRAGGSMRDAQSLLDQLLAFAGEKLTVAQVHQLLGTANEDRVVELAGAIVARDAVKTLLLFDQAAEQGLQLGELLDQLLDYWRDLMVVNAAGVDEQTLSVPSSLRATVATQAKQLPPDTILAGLDILVTARQRMRATSHGRVVVEMALVRLCRLEDLLPLSQLAQLVRDGGVASTSTSKPAGSPAPSLMTRMVASASSPDEKKKETGGFEPVNPQKVINSEPLSPEQLWQQVISDAGLMLSGELRKVTSLATSGPNALVVRFPPRYNQPGQPNLDPTRLARVEELLRKITGQTWKVIEEIDATASANGQSAANAPGQEPAANRVRRQRSELAQVPLLGKAMDVLGAQIVQMDETFGTQPTAPVVKQESAADDDDPSPPSPEE